MNVWPGDETHNPWLLRYWRNKNWDPNCNAQSTMACYNLSSVSNRDYCIGLIKYINT